MVRGVSRKVSFLRPERHRTTGRPSLTGVSKGAMTYATLAVIRGEPCECCSWGVDCAYMDALLPANGTCRIRPGRRLSLRQALDLQRLVYDTAFSEKAKIGEIAQLVQAWDVLEDRKRELRGRPKLKSVEPPTKEADKGKIQHVTRRTLNTPLPFRTKPVNQQPG